MTHTNSERVIKFRCWDIDGCVWLGEDEFYIFPSGVICAWNGDDDVENTILSQFTGLHDKNGKEIYEGDIVSRKDFPDGRYSVKYFEDDGAFGFWENTILGAKERFWFAMHSKKYEVIGNIYENGDLLK